MERMPSVHGVARHCAASREVTRGHARSRDIVPRSPRMRTPRSAVAPARPPLHRASLAPRSHARTPARRSVAAASRIDSAHPGPPAPLGRSAQPAVRASARHRGARARRRIPRRPPPPGSPRHAPPDRRLPRPSPRAAVRAARYRPRPSIGYNFPFSRSVKSEQDHGSGTSERDRKLPRGPAPARGRATGVSLTTTSSPNV